MEEKYKELITKEDAIDIIKWGEEQGHIYGDIDLIVNTIYNHEQK